MGPLSGIKIIEFAGIGPCPMGRHDAGRDGRQRAAKKLDRVEDSGLGIPLATKDDLDMLKLSRAAIVGLDLKHPDGRAPVLRLLDSADALIEGFRPG